MSTVDDAVQAGARALWFDFHADEDPAWVAMSWDDMGGSEPTDERGEYEIAAHAALAAAWPILSAPIRELHRPEPRGIIVYDPERVIEIQQCAGCAERFREVYDSWEYSAKRGIRHAEWPCPDMQLIIETDKELGL